MIDALSLSQAQVEAMGEPEADAALDAWVKAKRHELPEALARSSSKLHARLAKRALYRLKSSGLEVATPQAIAQLPQPLASAPEEFPAVLSAILGTGERAVFFVRPVRGGGLEVFQGILNDERGVMQLEGGTAKRSTYRKRIEELQADPSLKVLLVPWERMKLELGRALAMNDRTGTRPTDESADILRRLDVVAENPDWDVPAVEAGDEALAAGAKALHEHPELKQWLPSEPAIAELGRRLDPIELAGQPLGEAAQRQAREVAQGYLTRERRKIYARRLWAMAELFDRSSRAEAAGLARAEARVLYHLEIPSLFVEAMFDAVVARRRAALEEARAHVHSPGARLAPPVAR